MPELVSALGVTSGLEGRHLLRIADWTPPAAGCGGEST